MLEKEMTVKLNPFLLFGLTEGSGSEVVHQFVSGGALQGTLSFEMTETCLWLLSTAPFVLWAMKLPKSCHR